jgi:hypothetical protein
MTCPKCRRRQYITCSNRECVCWQRVPKGKRTQRTVKPDGLACPYCGFVAHIDYWEDREVEAVLKAAGVSSLTELVERHELLQGADGEKAAQ